MKHPGRPGRLTPSTARGPRRAAIERHFHHIARAFKKGNFEMPMFIHDRGLPKEQRNSASANWPSDFAARSLAVRTQVLPAKVHQARFCASLARRSAGITAVELPRQFKG